ncbi:adenylate kinase [Nocardia jiangsuensis]|uniref:Adenylate kinase n=1 Tax=Nocardia jiangsuensis TaxID=1691563 RepID=A0ABV8DMC2_9NOCA
MQQPGGMNKVVILGRGEAGKSTLAARLGTATGLPVVELDKHFWPADLTPIHQDRWAAVQRQLIAADRWILDGDLGPYDVLPVRLAAADTVIVLDFPLRRCAWRAARRSRENLAFWRWLLGYRRRSLPIVLAAIAEHAGAADVHRLRNPREVDEFLSRASTKDTGTPPRG